MEELVIKVCVEMDLEDMLQQSSMTTLKYLQSIDLEEDTDEHLDNLYQITFSIYSVETDINFPIDQIESSFLLDLAKRLRHSVDKEILYRTGTLPRVVDLNNPRRLLYRNIFMEEEVINTLL